MEVLLIMLMNISYLVIIFFEFRAKSLTLIFWGALFAVFSVPHSMDIILETNIYPCYVMNIASLYAIGFNFIYLIIRYLLVYRSTKFNWTISEENGRIENRFMRYLFLMLIISVLLWIFGLYKVTGSIYNSSWSDTLLVRGKYSIAASYLFMSSGGLLILLFLKGKNKLSKVLCLILSLIIVFLTRARINLIPFIFPVMIYYVFYKKNYKSLLKVALIGLIFIVMVAFLQEFRFLGSLSNAKQSDMKLVFERAMKSILSGHGESALRNGMYKFIYYDNKFENFGKGITYIRLLLLPFPNSIIKIKPRDFAYDMWDVINPNRTGIGGTYHPTFLGDLYGNFGEYGFVFGVLWAIIFFLFDKITDKLPNEVKLALVAPFSTMYLLLARGSVYNAIANGFWSLVVIKITFFISRITLSKDINKQ